MWSASRVGNTGLPLSRERQADIRLHKSRIAQANPGRSNLPEAAFLEPRFSYLDRKRPGREISPLLGLFKMIMVRAEPNVNSRDPWPVARGPARRGRVGAWMRRSVEAQEGLSADFAD